MPAIAESTSLRVKLSLSEDILRQYEERARATGVALEELLARRLTETVGQTANRPIYFNDAARIELEGLLGHNLGGAKQVLDAVGKLARIRTGPATINLNEALLARLRSRCPRNKKFDDYLGETMVMLLEQFTGLR